MTASTGTEPRLDSVEITVTFSDAGAAVATRALAPDHGGARRRVYFCEAPAPARATGQLPLLDAGVILRLREGGGGGDATAELRPCRRSRLSERWLGFGAQGADSFRVRSQWSGESQVLSAAFTSDCGRPAVDAVASGACAPGEAFSERQRSFLGECADVPVGFGSLDVLGPVGVVRWDDVRLDHHEVTLERWSVAGAEPLEWLEVTERVAPEGAEVVQASLTVLLRSLGLEPDLKQGTRTRRVLEVLARDA